MCIYVCVYIYVNICIYIHASVYIRAKVPVPRKMTEEHVYVRMYLLGTYVYECMYIGAGAAEDDGGGLAKGHHRGEEAARCAL